MSTSISPIITAASNATQMLITSPQRGLSSSPPTTSTNGNQPIALISSVNNHLTITDQQVTSSSAIGAASIKVASALPNGLTTKSNGVKNMHGSNHIAINFTTADGISPLLTATSAAMPITLNGQQQVTANGNGIQIIGTTSSIVNGKNGVRKSLEEHAIITKDHVKMEPMTAKIDAEPPTKVIKLLNGNTIALASMDKEHKLIPSGQLTLSQVVVSQIPLLTSSQGQLRVIGQAPNGLATIELSNSNREYNARGPCVVALQSISYPNINHLYLLLFEIAVQPRNIPNQGQHQATIIPNGTNGAQLQKLLVSSGPAGVTSTIAATSELARLPGGAELNILPSGTNGATIYRGNGKLAIVNNGITIKGKRYWLIPFIFNVDIANCLLYYLIISTSVFTYYICYVTSVLFFGIRPLAHTHNTNLYNHSSLDINQANRATTLSALTPIVVTSQGQNNNLSLSHVIATTPQLAGKVN